MALSGCKSPFMFSLTVTTSAQSFLTLMRVQRPDSKNHVQFLSIQADTTIGSTIVYIGNSDVALTMCGYNVQAGQAPVVFGGDSSLIIPGDIYLVCSTGTAQVNCCVITR